MTFAADGYGKGRAWLMDGARWLEVGGPPGSGKTTLARTLWQDCRGTSPRELRWLDEPDDATLSAACADAQAADGGQWIVARSLCSGFAGRRIVVRGVGHSTGELTDDGRVGFLTRVLAAQGVEVRSDDTEHLVAIADAVGGNPSALDVLGRRAQWHGPIDLATAVRNEAAAAELLFADCDGPLGALHRSMERCWVQLGASGQEALVRLSVSRAAVPFAYVLSLPECRPEGMQRLSDAGLIHRSGRQVSVDAATRLFALWRAKDTRVHAARRDHDVWVTTQLEAVCSAWVTCGDQRSRSQLLAMRAEACRPPDPRDGLERRAAGTVARSCIHRVRGKSHSDRCDDEAALVAVATDEGLGLRWRLLATVELAWHTREVGAGESAERALASLGRRSLAGCDARLMHEARCVAALCAQDYGAAVKAAAVWTSQPGVEEAPLWAARANLNLGVAHQWSGDFDGAAAAYGRALSIAEREGDIGLESIAAANLAGPEMRLGRGERARELCARAHALSAPLGDPMRMVTVELHWGKVLHHLGSVDEAIAHFEEARARATSLDSPFRQAMVCANLADAYVSAGALDAAASMLARSDRLRRHYPGYAAEHLGAFIALTRLHLWVAQGRRQAVLRHLDHPPSATSSPPAAAFHQQAHLLGATVALRQGDVAAAHARLTHAEGIAARPDPARARVAALTQALLASRRGGGQTAVVAELATWLGRSGAPRRHNVLMMRRTLDELGPTLSDEQRRAALCQACAHHVAASERLLALDGAARVVIFASDAPIALSPRPLLWRLVQALAQRQVQHQPFAGVDDLTQALWPGEAVLEGAARNRVYNAVALLRKRGLKEAIAQGPEGYGLASGVRVAAITPGAWRYALDDLETA